MDMCLSKLWDIVKDRETWHTAVHVISKSQTGLSDWTTTRRAGIPQAKQPERWEHSPTHQQTSSLKTWAHSYLKTPFKMALPIKGTRPSFMHEREGTSSYSKTACRSHWTNFTHQGADIQKWEELQSCSMWKGSHEHRKLDTMRWQRNMLQMKEWDKPPQNN